MHPVCAVLEDGYAEVAPKIVSRERFEVDQISDVALRDARTRSPDGGIKIVGPANGKFAIASSSNADYLCGLSSIFGERFFHEKMASCRHHLECHVEVRLRWRCYVDDVGTLLAQQTVKVGIPGVDPMAK